MKSVNTVSLLGYLTHDPELKQSTEGRAICSFGLATNRVWKNAKGEKQELAEFHNLVAWGKLAEICGQYLKKGKPAYVTGYLKTGSWEEPKGTKKYRTEIVVDDVVFLGTPDHVQEEDVAEEAVAA